MKISLKKKTIKYLNKLYDNKLDNKTFIVTGSTSGVGLKTAIELLYLGAKVIFAIRNISKALSIIDEIKLVYRDIKYEILELDLSSLESIDEFVKYIISNNIDIDGFINNAGTYSKNKEYTKDGFELNIGTNYIGTYYLTNKLIPYFRQLNHDVILINTTSISYKYIDIDYDDFFKDKEYSKFKTYSLSKLCTLKYTLYLFDELNGSNIKVYMTHPGITYSPLILKAYNKFIAFLVRIFRFIFLTSEDAARANLLCISGKVKENNLYGPHLFFDVYGKPKKNKIKKKAYKEIDKLINYTNILLTEKTK